MRRSDSGAMVVPSNEGGEPHCQTPNKFCGHITFCGRRVDHFTASRPTILRPHHLVAGAWSFHHFTTDHASPQLHYPASDTGKAAGSGSDDDGDDGMLPCIVQSLRHGHLRHPWAPAASIDTPGIHGHFRHPWASPASISTSGIHRHRRHPWAPPTSMGTGGIRGYLHLQY